MRVDGEGGGAKWSSKSLFFSVVNNHLYLLLVLAFLAVSAPDAPAAAPFAATSHRSFSDLEHWTEVFDAPDRDQWQAPEKVVKTLGIVPGMRVADLGAGTGYFSAHLSRAVGSAGTVFAVETEPNLIVHLRSRAETEGTTNVVPVLASFDNPRLPKQSLDLVVIVDTFHHIDARLDYFRRLADVFTSQGRLVVVDWRAGELEKGPPPAHKLARETVISELDQAGYELKDSHDFLAYQYFLVFTPR